MSSFHIRMVTAGAPLDSADDVRLAQAAVRFLERARDGFAAAGLRVQTLRLATQPLGEYAPDWAAPATSEAILQLDRLALEHDLYCGIGPAIVGDEHDARFPSWAAELTRRTRQTGFSVSVASPDQGVQRRSVRLAAETMAALAEVDAAGEGNFLFSAAALVPAGTPFFPVAWFRQPRTFSLGLESAGLVSEVCAAAPDRRRALADLRRCLNDELGAVERTAGRIAEATGWRYLGMDVSPAPSPAASIAEAVESLSGAPFGSPSTLAACADLTGILRTLDVRTCGYSGLMLPLLEDRVLARRAAEGRFGLTDLLLYSSVCGTGLDTVPLPGDTSPGVLAAIIEDVAALAVRHGKPLAARLLPIPGKAVGDAVRIDNPHLTDGVVMDPAS